MAVSRANAVAYLVGHYGSGANALLGLAGVGLTDDTGGLKEPIDDAALLLGVSYSSLASASIADADAIGYLAALRYTTLKRIIAGLNAKSQQGVASVGNGVSLDVRDWVARLKGELAIAATEARQQGVNIPAGDLAGLWPMADLWSISGIGLDFIEPEEATV